MDGTCGRGDDRKIGGKKVTQNHAECRRGARLYSYASFPIRNERGSHPIGKQTRILDDLRRLLESSQLPRQGSAKVGW